MTDPVSTRYKEALRRGHVAVVKGRPREAVQHYQEAADLAGQRPLALVSMGGVYLQMRQPREALVAFDEALKRAPADLDAMRGKAQALQAAGRAEDSKVVFARLAELEAQQRSSQRSVPAVDPLTLELERHIEAGAAARAAGDVNAACMAYLTAANGYSAANDFDAALDACLRALEARPGNIDVHFTMAVMYLRRGWAELGAQRVVLIEHRLDVDDDPRRRAALQALARDHRVLSPELERIAATAV
jgi:tetratricopeptide (TPR) repeat protein